MPTRAPLVANLLLALVSGLVALVLCEGILRVHYAWSRPTRLDDLATERPMPPVGSEVGLGDLIQPSPHERLVFELRPGLDVRFTAVQIETNSRGWREVEHALDAPPNTVRILGIGDSVMFGWGVDREQRYTDLFGAKLGERYPDIQWQTLTLACPGWNLVMEVEALERYGLAFEPDLILY
ncbi:MAG: SGNH/GDSL hydrolase family protein, partial [Acidobacteriota bacterium]